MLNAGRLHFWKAPLTYLSSNNAVILAAFRETRERTMNISKSQIAELERVNYAATAAIAEVT
ncbi:MAG TPA: hypothetical protein VEC96_01650, partial [Anaerolineae bacterium]|nr:hypothetical protein [Anaerolineae bacterium]